MLVMINPEMRSRDTETATTSAIAVKSQRRRNLLQVLLEMGRSHKRQHLAGGCACIAESMD
jgi:hypothetical protein